MVLTVCIKKTSRDALPVAGGKVGLPYNPENVPVLGGLRSHAGKFDRGSWPGFVEENSGNPVGRANKKKQIGEALSSESRPYVALR